MASITTTNNNQTPSSPSPSSPSPLPSFESIPILDFNDLTISRPAFLAALRHAITDIGFLYAKNFGLAQDNVSSLTSLLPDLFALSDTEKESIALESSPHFLGYSAVGSETTAGATDVREQFEFGHGQSSGAAASPSPSSPSTLQFQMQMPYISTSVSTPDGPDRHYPQSPAVAATPKPLYANLIGPNQYPPSLPQTRTIIEIYMTAMADRAVFFMRLVAEALDLPPNTFLPFLGAQNRLKIVRYPPVENADENRVGVGAGSAKATTTQGVGPHKDSSGWWTFLLQASPPHVQGLQVLNKVGKWVDVPNIPGTIVVNIGQAFEVVTHGACKATTHRVLGGPCERFSVPFFLGVRGDLTKKEALGALERHFTQETEKWRNTRESMEGMQIDSPFLRGRYDTWGESQLRTKIRSHREAGKRFYPEVYERYINDT